jgi:hypothetical protein
VELTAALLLLRQIHRSWHSCARMTNEDEVGRHGALLASILVGATTLRRGPRRQHLHPRARCSRQQHLARPPLAAPAARGSHTHAKVPPTGYSPCRWTQVAARRSRRAAAACRNLLALAAPPRASRLTLVDWWFGTSPPAANHAGSGFFSPASPAEHATRHLGLCGR